MLLTLLYTMQQRIVEYLKPEDLLRLVGTCRDVRSLCSNSDFWAHLLWTQLKYKAPDGTSVDELRQYYFTLSTPIKKSCSRHLFGPHTNNDSYWNLQAGCRESEYGKVARLRSVWWLECGIKFENIPPGRYALVWRVALENRITMFHTIIPVRAREAVMKRGGDGYLQCCLKEPTPEESIETPVVEHTHASPDRHRSFYPRFDEGEDWYEERRADAGPGWENSSNESWYYIVAPSALVVKELSDVVSGVCLIDASMKSNMSFDYCQLILLEPEDSVVRNSKAVQRVAPNNLILNFF